MRRQEKECKDEAKLKSFLEKMTHMQIALNSPGTAPYIVPVNYIYHNGALYFHSATEGRKVELIKADPVLGFAINEQCIIRQGGTACATGTAYRSVIGHAEASIVEEGKTDILNLFVKRFTAHENVEYSSDILSKVFIFKLSILSISFKTDEKGI